MPFEITMPQLGLTMESGVLVKWCVQEGDRIAPGEQIFEVETDKATVAVEAHEEGTIERILVSEGQEVPVGTLLAIAVAAGETLPTAWQPVHPSVAPAPVLWPAPQVALPSAKPSADAGLQASWKARTLAHQAGLDWRTIAGSGPGGRVVAEDVTQALASAAAVAKSEPKATSVAAKLAASLGLDLSAVVGSGPQGRITQSDVLEAAAAIIRERAVPRPVPMSGPAQVLNAVPLTGVRQVVSERMAVSAHSTARVTLFREVDATGLVDLRERFISRGLQVSYNDILVKICAVSLREHPEANARMGDGQIEYLGRIHIGLAVDTDRGLLVPVIRNADLLTVPQIAVARSRLIEAARAGYSLPDDLTGGTFTLTNLGMLGVEGFTPVINLPECCILGVGRMVRKPVVVDESDTLAVRPMMILSLAFDHRVIDGAPAARFLERVVQLVQDPWLLLTVN